MSLSSLRALQVDMNEAINTLVRCHECTPHNKKIISKRQSDLVQILDNLRDDLIPTTTRIRQLGLQLTLTMSIRIAIDLDLFDLIPDRGISMDELIVHKAGADPHIVVRVLRALAANRIIMERPGGNFAATPMSRTLRRPEVAAWVKLMSDTNAPILFSIPAFLRRTGHRNMSYDSNATQDKYGENFFEFIARDPERQGDFDMAMKLQDDAPAETKPLYPFESVEDESQVLLVDVGGGRGQAIESLLERLPDLQGRFILQDVPSVISSLPIHTFDSRIEAQAHDVFTPQPVCEAKYYFYRKIFHDHSDARCLVALKSLHGAMSRHYSKLLISDIVLPDSGCSAVDTLSDLTMMVCAGQERSENEWKALLFEGGFRLTRIFKAETKTLGVIEAELLSVFDFLILVCLLVLRTTNNALSALDVRWPRLD